MSIAALSAIAKDWTQLKCSPACEWMSIQWNTSQQQKKQTIDRHNRIDESQNDNAE